MKTKLYTRIAMVFATILMFSFYVTAQTTISVKVAEADDDVEEYQQAKSDTEPAGFMDHGSSDLELCNETEGVQQLVGIIYRNVQIPAGSTINNAYVQFTADDDNDEAITLNIWGAKLATVPAPFTADLFGVSSKPKTTAMVSWTPAPWMVLEERGVNQQTPDISSIIQEIIGVSGWAPGNNILIMLLDPSGTVKQHRESEAFEDNAGAGASELFVTYSAGGTGINSERSEIAGAIYPNPTEGTVYINNPSKDNFSYEIYAISGKLISSRQDISGSNIEVDMSGFTKGVYFVKVNSSEITQTHKLIVK